MSLIVIHNKTSIYPGIFDFGNFIRLWNEEWIFQPECELMLNFYTVSEAFLHKYCILRQNPEILLNLFFSF